MNKIKIAERWVGIGEPTYFVADIAANHDGDLERAKYLVSLAKEAGADAVKFQNFQADKIVSRKGFESLGGKYSHQSKWNKSVFEVYQDASIPFTWSEELYNYCRDISIHYFSSPYDFEAVDMLDQYVPAYKIGSGDITWPEMLKKISSKNKPVLLATGASELKDVLDAVDLIMSINPNLILMQCNTNYTAEKNNFRFIHLNVLKLFEAMFPDIVLGLSDHTPGHATVLGAVALGARVIEKHFTDDTKRSGPDHAFSMTPDSWREMVDRTKELEDALGSTIKRVEENERQTVILQRRCLRASRDLKSGTILARDMIDVLRPAPQDAIYPYDLDRLMGMKLLVDVSAGEYFKYSFICPAK